MVTHPNCPIQIHKSFDHSAWCLTKSVGTSPDSILYRLDVSHSYEGGNGDTFTFSSHTHGYDYELVTHEEWTERYDAILENEDDATSNGAIARLAIMNLLIITEAEKAIRQELIDTWNLLNTIVAFQVTY
jgi:hypothetical protein